MSNTFKGRITITNDLTNQEYNPVSDVIFTVSGSTVTLSFNDNQIVETSDLDESGNPISYQIFKKFDREILWDFGDGTKIKGLTATHTYKNPGSYSVTCTCFDADENPYKNSYPKAEQTIKVVDILPTIISYTSAYLKKVEAGLLKNVYAGQQIEVAEVIATLDKSITNKVPIKCHAVKAGATNIFDLPPNNPYQHLLPYNTFLDEDNEPTLSIIPEYKDVYVVFDYSNDSGLILNLYIINPEMTALTEVEPLIVDSSIKYICNTLMVPSLDSISTLNYYHIGQSGKASIKFQDDLPSSQDELTFVLDTDYFPDDNVLLGKNTINLVSIGTSLEIKQNNPNKLNIFISTNGLTTADNSDEHPIIDISLENNTFSFCRAKYLGIDSPFVIRLIADNYGYYFIKDIAIKEIIGNCENAFVEFYTGLESVLGIPYTSMGSCFGTLKPLVETDELTSTFNLSVSWEGTSLQKSNLSIDNLTFIDLKSFSNKDSKYYLDPKQDYTEYSAKEIWNIYKTHPVFENLPFLDQYMLGIFESDNFLEKVINKGNNFVNDFGNINTCSIISLVSICESLNLTLDLYNNENFSQPESINRLLKILSINHSRLIGTKFKVKDEFETLDKLPGKNRGPQYNLTEKIYIKTVNGKRIWPIIVCYDRFAKQYFLLNTALLEKVRKSPIKTDEQGEYFQLIEYFKTWGWNLLLGDFEKELFNIISPNKNLYQMLNLLASEPIEDKAREQLNKFYYFYQYIDTNETDIHNSYLKPETISDNIKDYNTWYKADGSIDRLLYKTLIENLGLN